MNENLEAKQFNKMINTPIKKLILSLSIPTIISMMVTAIYNTADTYFVAQLGESASGAVGIVFSMQAIIQAVGFTLGMGGGSLISRLLGKREKDEATVVANSSFFSALIFGVLFGIFGIIFVSPFMKLLGATDTILPYAIDYATYILIGAPIMCGSFVLNNLLRAEGKTLLSMIGLCTGALINIVMDPLFINDYGLGMGISGAALATIISQFISFAILISFFFTGKSINKINPLKMSLKFSTYFNIVKTGLPSFARQALASIATIILNRQAGVYGDSAVSAINISSKVYMLVFSVSLGIGQGYQPIVGYNYSAKHFERVREAFWFTYIVMTVLLAIFGVVFYINSRFIISLFMKDNQDVIDIGSTILKYHSLIYPTLSLNVITNMTFQSIGKKWTSTFLSSLRQGIFFLPIIILFPIWFGLFGIEIAQVTADLLSFLTTIPFIVYFLINLKKMEKDIILE